MRKQKSKFPTVLYVWIEKDSDDSTFFMESTDPKRPEDGEVAEYQLIRIGTKKTTSRIEFDSK